MARRGTRWRGSLVMLSGMVGLWPVVPRHQPVAAGPNIVVILTDDQSSESIPHVPTPMPYLESLLNNSSDHWVRFTRAFANTPLCCPARATLLSGQYSHHTGVQTNGDGDLFDETSTMATWLDDVGYQTGFFGKYLNTYPWDRGPYVPDGWDRWVAFESPPRYFDYTLIEDGNEVPYGSAEADYSTDVLAGKAVDFVDEASSSSPFLLFFAPYGPHYEHDFIWTPAPRHAGTFDNMSPIHHLNFNEADVSDKPNWVQDLPLLSPAEEDLMDENREDEYETLLSVDDAVKAILQSLATKGVLDSSIVVFLSDNGFSFGSHRWKSKTCQYEECIRVPMFVRYPGATPRADRRHLISPVDLAATVADAVGVTPPTPLDGLSLVPLLEGQHPTWRDGVLLRWRGLRGGGPDPEERFDFEPTLVAPYWAVRTTNYLYAELATGEKELYDLTGRIGDPDPYEIDNRAHQPDYREVRRRLADLVAELKASLGPSAR